MRWPAAGAARTVLEAATERLALAKGLGDKRPY